MLEGFRKDDNGRFAHDNGNWIARSPDNRALWERRSSSGDLSQIYWPKDHALDHLQIEADIWALLDKRPEMYALILAGTEGKPITISGARLRTMREQHEITLYPATYRILKEPR